MSSDEEGEGKETALSTAASLLKVSRLSFIVPVLRIRYVYLGFFSITDSTTTKKRRRKKLFSVLPFFIAIFTKLENNFILNCNREKMESVDRKFFYPRGLWDCGLKKHRIRMRNTHCYNSSIFFLSQTWRPVEEL
jgi:hypothetical protein